MHFRLLAPYAKELPEGCSREVLSLFLKHVSTIFPVIVAGFLFSETRCRVMSWLWKVQTFKSTMSMHKSSIPAHEVI